MNEADRDAVVRTVYEFAYGIDTRDWALFRSIFADEVDLDYSSYHGRPSVRMDADAWVDSVRPLFTGLDATQHTMSNPLVDLDGGGGADTTARCRMYMQAAHFLFAESDPEFTIGGYYDDRLALVDGRWRITAVTLTVWWRRGNESIMATARRRGAALLADSDRATG